MWQKLAWLALAGALGTLTRYAISGWTQRLAGESFPWGTLAVNMAGCFLFGFVWALAEDRLVISGETRFLILTGFMGAFTTFSTYAFETADQLRESQWLLATANVAAQTVGGLVLVLAGLALGRGL